MRSKTRLSVALLPVLPIVLLSTSAQAFNPDHLAQLLKTNQCANCDLSSAKLEKLNLSGANLQGANLSGVTLTGANLSNANLEAANLQGSSLTEAYLFRANLTDANFTNAGLQKANLRETTLVGTNFSGADLRSSDFQGNNLGQAKFPGSNLSGANLSKTIGFALVSQRTGENVLTNTSLLPQFICPGPSDKPSLEDLNQYAEGSGFRIQAVDFSGVNLTASNLQNVILINNDLSNVDLAGANLRSACLFGVKLTGAKLSKADLTDIRLVSTKLPPGTPTPALSPADQAAAHAQAAAQGTKAYQGKIMVGTLNRAQQAYYLENDRFTTSIEDSGVGIKPEMNDYRYRLFVAPDRHPSAMQVGLPKLSDLPTYIGLVRIEKTPKGDPISIAILCTSEKPATPIPLWSTIDYKNPKKGEPIACPKGFTKVTSGEDPNPPQP
jgi:uncharacterized protein YjbI with pentapeptide repeats